MSHRIVKLLIVAALVLAGCHKAEAGPYAAPTLKPVEVQAKITAGDPIVFVDVRSAAAYKREHITGAINTPSSKFNDGSQGLPKDKWLVLYCT